MDETDGPDYFYDETPDYDSDIMDCGCAEGMCYCDNEPDIDEQFEWESSMASAGWGTDEDYGYFGGDDDY